MKKLKIYETAIFTLILIFSLSIVGIDPAYAWVNGGQSIDPDNPKYGSHDFILDKAIDLLPPAMINKIDRTAAFYGTEIPDYDTCLYCIGDGGNHEIYYHTDESIHKDDAAIRAKEEGELAIIAYQEGDMYNFSLRIGSMAHYMSDPSAYAHTLGSRSDWGDNLPGLHGEYENYAENCFLKNRNCLSNSIIYRHNIVYDGNYDNISPYDGALKIAYDTTFDTFSRKHTNVWMRDNFDWGDEEFVDRHKESINYNVNILADTIYTMIKTLDPTIDPGTPTGPSIINYSPASLIIEDVVGTVLDFSVEIDKKADIKWYYDGILQKESKNKSQDSFNETVSIIGKHNITVIAGDENGETIKTWNLNVLGNLEIISDKSVVNIGIPINVTITVSRKCGIEQNDNCTLDSMVPIPGAMASVSGKPLKKSFVKNTDINGQAVLPINTTQNGTINVEVDNPGYINNNIAIVSEAIISLPTPTPTPDAGSGSSGSGGNSGGSSGSGSGGGGVTTKESYDNIVKYEVREKTISKYPVTFIYTIPELGIYEVVITGNQTDDATLRIELLKNKSKLTGSEAPGIIYKYINGWLDTNRINKVVIKYKVENSWINNNSLSASDIKMVKWNDISKIWVKLSTNVTNKDDKYTYFETETDGFSHFAINGTKEIKPVDVTLPLAGPDYSTYSKNNGRMESADTGNATAGSTEIVGRPNRPIRFEFVIMAIVGGLILYMFRIKK